MRRSTFCLTLASGLAAPVFGANIPRPAPELLIELPGNRTILLSSIKGKVVALQFILTTCPHCQQACRTMQQLYAEYGPKGLQPLAVAINQLALAAVPQFIRDWGITYPVGAQSNEKAIEFLQHPMMIRMMMPQVAFIDRQGIIRAQYSGDSAFYGANTEENVRKQVEELLGVGAAKKAPRKAAPGKAARKQ